MTDREKLRKLIHTAIAEWEHGEVDEKIADHLIANGVTFANETTVVPGHDDQYNIAEMAYNNGYAKGLEDGKPKWISVEERLPEENMSVLLLCKNNAIFVGFLGRYYSKSDELRFLIHTALNSTKRLNKGRVTHWMPLPEPPQTE